MNCGELKIKFSPSVRMVVHSSLVQIVIIQIWKEAAAKRNRSTLVDLQNRNSIRQGWWTRKKMQQKKNELVSIASGNNLTSMEHSQRVYYTHHKAAVTHQFAHWGYEQWRPIYFRKLRAIIPRLFWTRSPRYLVPLQKFSRCTHDSGMRNASGLCSLKRHEHVRP